MYIANNLSMIVFLFCIDSIVDSTIYAYHGVLIILCII